MYLLEPMSAEPTSSLYESVDQPLPSSSASPQCISRLNFEESLIAVVMLMMPGSSDLTKTTDRVFSHSTSPHWSAAKRSSPIKSYRRRTVCLFPDPSSLLPDSATAEPTFVDLSSHHWLRQRRWVSVSMVCDCLRLAMVCCMLWKPILIALSTVWQWFCLLPDRLLDCCQTLGVCCQTRRWRSQPFVCLLLLVKLITKREMNISAQSLRPPRTRPGMLHVMDTHTHHRIYSVTVDYATPPC